MRTTHPARSCILQPCSCTSKLEQFPPVYPVFHLHRSILCQWALVHFLTTERTIFHSRDLSLNTQVIYTHRAVIKIYSPRDGRYLQISRLDALNLPEKPHNLNMNNLGNVGNGGSYRLASKWLFKYCPRARIPISSSCLAASVYLPHYQDTVEPALCSSC